MFHESFYPEKQVGLQYCLTWSCYIKLHQYSICLLQNLHKKGYFKAYITASLSSSQTSTGIRGAQCRAESPSDRHRVATADGASGWATAQQISLQGTNAFPPQKNTWGRSPLGKPVDKRWDINISFCNRGWIWMCYFYVVSHDLRYPHCPRFEASPPPNCNLEPQAVNGLFEGIASTMVLLYAFWSLGVKVSLEQNSVFCLLS